MQSLCFREVLRVDRAGRAVKNNGAAFWLHAALLTVFIGASSAPSPLYEFYARQWGLGSAAVTVVFAVYAVAVLLTQKLIGAKPFSLLGSRCSAVIRRSGCPPCR